MNDTNNGPLAGKVAAHVLSSDAVNRNLDLSSSMNPVSGTMARTEEKQFESPGGSNESKDTLSV
ncbi:hypothetical protein DPSP01_000420 [Paraphaeosphaeria sporulosa]